MHDVPARQRDREARLAAVERPRSSGRSRPVLRRRITTASRPPERSKAARTRHTAEIGQRAHAATGLPVEDLDPPGKPARPVHHVHQSSRGETLAVGAELSRTSTLPIDSPGKGTIWRITGRPEATSTSFSSIFAPASGACGGTSLPT